jgi:hypothetical protein
MSLYEWALVIFLAALVAMLAVAWWTGREPSVPLARLADPAPLPWEPPAPWPVDTGPLLIMSEQMAANAALAREVEWLIRESYERIGPVAD